jgi:hypothetical protein
MFTTLLVFVGALFMAVFAGTALDPRPSSAARDADDRAETDGTALAETIALSHF